MGMAEKRWEVRGKGGDENVLKSIVVVVVPSLLPGRLVPESKTCLKPIDLCTLSGWIVWYRNYISKKAITKIKERNGKKKKCMSEWESQELFIPFVVLQSISLSMRKTHLGVSMSFIPCLHMPFELRVGCGLQLSEGHRVVVIVIIITLMIRKLS